MRWLNYYKSVPISSCGYAARTVYTRVTKVLENEEALKVAEDRVLFLVCAIDYCESVLRYALSQGSAMPETRKASLDFHAWAIIELSRALEDCPHVQKAAAIKAAAEAEFAGDAFADKAAADKAAADKAAAEKAAADKAAAEKAAAEKAADDKAAADKAAAEKAAADKAAADKAAADKAAAEKAAADKAAADMAVVTSELTSYEAHMAAGEIARGTHACSFTTPMIQPVAYSCACGNTKCCD